MPDRQKWSINIQSSEFVRFSGRSFKCPFSTWLFCSFVRSFFHSFFRSFFLLFVRSFLRSFVLSFFHSFVLSFVRSFVRRPDLFCLHTVGVEVVYFHLITLRHTLKSVGLLWTRAGPSQRPTPDNTNTVQETNIHAPSGIPTHDPSKRSAADLRLRPRGHWDRLKQCSCR
jgi:hypothetical protein